MKKIILSLIIFTCTLSVHAQRQGLWIAPHFTIGAGTMTQHAPSFLDVDASAVFALGGDVYYMFNNHIGAGTGMAFGGYGYQWTYNFYSESLEYTGTQGTVDIPLYFRYVSGKGGNGFFVNAGLIHHFLITAKEKVKGSGHQLYTTEGSEAREDFAKWTISPFVYFGGNIRCSNKVQMTLGPQITYQLPDNFSEDSGLNGHYLIFALKLGVGIHTWSKK